MSLNDEFKLISEIQRTLGKPSKRVVLGIGDDAAVVQSPKGKLVATVDTMVEGVHFDLSYMTPRELGHKALAVNLSDLAAMGATPLYALVSLGLPQSLSEPFLVEFYEGMRALAKKYRVDVIGGNLSQSPSTLLVDVTALGEVAGDGVKRSAARLGDLIVVTGDLGLSAAGLNILKRLGRGGHEKLKPAFNRHLKPEPRVKESEVIARTPGIGAMIDISDGLARELHHIGHASGVGVLIDESLIPVSESTRFAAKEISADPRPWVLYGGEDYELCFTLQKSSYPKLLAAMKKLRTPLTVIGEIVPKSKGLKIKTLEGETVSLQPKGWNHFVRRGPPRQKV